MSAGSRLQAITEAAGRVLALPFVEEPLTGMLAMECMQCKQPMESKPCVAALDGKVSHGLHISCVPAYKAAMMEPAR